MTRIADVDRLLAATTSFWQALRIRFKWFTIRGFRPYRADDWSAFVSWAVGGVGLWIVIGTCVVEPRRLR